MFSFAQLEYAIALDTFKNFKRASEHCYVTQPTLSMQIKKLEDSLGVILFDRSKMPVVTTDIGTEFIKQARTILRERDKMSELIDVFNDQIKGELHLGVIPSVAAHLLPLFIVELNLKYPDLNIFVHEMVTDQVVAGLKNEVLDVGIIVTPADYKQIDTQPLYYEEIGLYVSEDHPFYQMDKVAVDQLQTRDMWMLKEGHCFRNQSLNLCGGSDEDHQEKRFWFESSSIETLVKMVDLQGGFTLIPELMVESIAAERHPQIKWMSGQPPVREVSLATYRNFTKRRMVDVLVETIKNVLPGRMLEKKTGNVVEWQ